MKATLKAWLLWHKYDWETKPEYKLNSTDMSGCGPEWVAVSQHEFEVDIPESFDPRPQQIKELQAEKDKILAEAHVKTVNIDEQIQRLLCIEHKPDAQP